MPDEHSTASTAQGEQPDAIYKKNTRKVLDMKEELAKRTVVEETMLLPCSAE